MTIKKQANWGNLTIVRKSSAKSHIQPHGGGCMKEYNGFLVDENFNIYNKHNGRKLSPYLGSDGYMHVRRRENKKIYYCRVHTIIANCFVENPNNYKYVNHIDSDKTNNDPNNLEWCTNSENVAHAFKEKGSTFHKRYTHVVVHDLDGNFIGVFESLREVAKVLKVDRHVVARILKGERKNNYPYVFEYESSPSTIESITVEKNNGEEASRVH